MGAGCYGEHSDSAALVIHMAFIVYNRPGAWRWRCSISAILAVSALCCVALMVIDSHEGTTIKESGEAFSAEEASSELGVAPPATHPRKMTQKSQGWRKWAAKEEIDK